MFFETFSVTWLLFENLNSASYVSVICLNIVCLPTIFLLSSCNFQIRINVIYVEGIASYLIGNEGQ